MLIVQLMLTKERSAGITVSGAKRIERSYQQYVEERPFSAKEQGLLHGDRVATA